MRGMNRRDFVRASIAGPLLASVAPARAAKLRVAVVGAGAFGGWTALSLRRAGADVTLLDAWGPGNARASSGGETRVIRGMYGDRAIYTRLAARALALWAEADRAWRSRFYVRTGGLWMFGDDDAYAREAAAAMREARLPLEALDPADAARRFPQVSFAGIRSCYLEAEAGYLLARRACEAVADALVRDGGAYRQSAVRTIEPGTRTIVRMTDGSTLSADRYVFACGPWLGRLFPDAIGDRIKPTRQEVFYFGTPPGDDRFLESKLPVWVDFRSRLMYGIPGNAHRGFKVADDTRGELFDPTTGDRGSSPASLEVARRFLAERFPLLADAPLLGSEVCQYENSPDAHFIVDRHPAAPDVWIAGGGSGHGFKMGPAIGEIVARAIVEDAAPDPQFRLARLSPTG
jgi:glycine/D-amino acid oxidase-like deaminating enzyme